MKTEIEENWKVSSSVVPVAPSKMFTYPTRLMDAYQPGILEINLPGYQIDGRQLEIIIRQGSTASLDINKGKIHKRIYKNMTPPIQMSNEYIHDSRYETEGNIAHILTIVAPPLLLARKKYPNITVVLRKNAFIRGKEIYNYLGFPVLCTDINVKGKLVLASYSHKNQNNTCNSHIGFLSSIFGKLSFEGFNFQTPERVFISRKKTRRLVNEDEIEQTLQEYGFEKVYFEDLLISEQWSITRNAKVIVGMHGAALSNLVFNRKGVKVVELFHPGYVVDLYRKITNAIGGTWCGITGQITDSVIRELDFKQKTGRKYALSSPKIDSISLQMALDYLGIEKK